MNTSQHQLLPVVPLVVYVTAVLSSVVLETLRQEEKEEKEGRLLISLLFSFRTRKEECRSEEEG